jgi:hypothetical protein
MIPLLPILNRRRALGIVSLAQSLLQGLVILAQRVEQLFRLFRR